MKSDTYRYNWTEVKLQCKSDIRKIKKFLKMVNYSTKDELQQYLLSNKYALRILTKKNSCKQSFMINVEGFLENYMNATDDEMFIYLDLVSKRDYFTYLNTKKKVDYLPIWKVENIYEIKKLKTNRLLYISDTNIYFVYEGDLKDE